MKKLSAMTVAAVLLAGGFATYTSEAQVHQGLQEVAFSGSYVHGTRDNNERELTVQLEYGYFFTDQLQLVGQGTINSHRVPDGQGGRSTETWGRVGGGVDWHFTMQGMQNFVPYVGARYLFGVGDDLAGETPSDRLQAHVGVNQFITRSVAVKYQLGYGFDPSETSDAGVDARIGLAFFF